MKKIPRMMAAVLALVLLLSLAGCGSSDGKTHLTFQIWDTQQRKGMEDMCAAYTAQHPDVVIRQNVKIRQLVQEIAILDKRIRELEQDDE